MRAILENPYRTLGLLTGTSAKEQQIGLRKLRMLIEAGQEPPEDYSFPFLGALNRTVETIDKAGSQLNTNNDRINAAIFWFYDGDTADGAAFDNLKAGKVEAAIRDCWNKKISSGSVFQNLSTLKLTMAFRNGAIDLTLLQEAISLKLSFLESDACQEWINRATDATFKTTKTALQKYFLGQLFSEIEKTGLLSLRAFFDIINRNHFTAKQELIRDLTRKPTDQLEFLLTELETRRNDGPANAHNAATRLLDQAEETLPLLAAILGAADPTFSSLSDRIAAELIQYCIDAHYINMKGDTSEPAKKTLHQSKRAKALAVSTHAKKDADEKVQTIQRGIDDFSSLQRIRPQMKTLTDQVENFQEFEGSGMTIGHYPTYVYRFVQVCTKELASVKLILGGEDQFYQKLSNNIACKASDGLVFYLNYVSNQVNPGAILATYAAGLDGEQNLIGSICRTLGIVEKMYMIPTTRSWFQENYSEVKKARKDLLGS